MEEDIEKLLADRKRRLQWTARIALFGACAMTFGFYLSGCPMLTIPDKKVPVAEVIYDRVLMAMAATILWCIYVQYAEAARFMKFFRQVLGKIKPPGLHSGENTASQSRE